MRLYCGIDLHSNNCVVVVSDEEDRIVLERRVRNELALIVGLLARYVADLVGVVVESTYNWYWLVDGLQAAGHRVHLANPAGNEQYKGLKYTDDRHDARWLAKLLRLGILREGYIYPKEARAVRDLLRERMRLVQMRTGVMVRMQTMLAQQAAASASASAQAMKRAPAGSWVRSSVDLNVGAGLESYGAVVRSLSEQIEALEETVLAQVRPAAQYGPLTSIAGVGEILGLTILLETGAIERFAKPGQFASYARCVQSQRLSNGKKKGQNNAKCGNAFLAWAFVEAANYAVRYSPRARRYFDTKKAKTNSTVAFKAVAHKLARAAWHIMRTHESFDEKRAFG